MGKRTIMGKPRRKLSAFMGTKLMDFQGPQEKLHLVQMGKPLKPHTKNTEKEVFEK